MTNNQSLIALWQDEEKRLRSIIKDPQTSAIIRDQVSERLASVLDQIIDLADELAPWSRPAKRLCLLKRFDIRTGERTGNTTSLPRGV
jgi:hypothetical protein